MRHLLSGVGLSDGEPPTGLPLDRVNETGNAKKNNNTPEKKKPNNPQFFIQKNKTVLCGLLPLHSSASFYVNFYLDCWPTVCIPNRYAGEH